MKKILSFSIAFLLLLLTGCENIKDVKKEPLTFSGFNTIIKTELNGVVLTANVTFTVANGYEFEFTSPKTLKNTCVSYNGESLMLTGEGLSLDLPREKLNKAMICRALIDCVDAVSGALPVEESENLQYAYRVENTPCSLYTDNNKIFKTLIVGDREFTFESFSYM